VESITKNGQPEETLRAMAARAYGLGQVPAAGEDWVCELGTAGSTWPTWCACGTARASCSRTWWSATGRSIEGGFTATEFLAFGDPAAFIGGYGHGKRPQDERVRRRLYCLHLSLVMVIETVYRGHADTRQYNFAREELTEAMARLGRRPGW